jgi:hypothetical protein
MSKGIDALLIFCEGPHDTAFVRMMLKKLMNYELKVLRFSEMPAPFNALFEQSIRKHAPRICL